MEWRSTGRDWIGAVRARARVGGCATLGALQVDARAARIGRSAYVKYIVRLCGLGPLTLLQGGGSFTHGGVLVDAHPSHA